jgi:membrane-associated protease RseP (regulator of RpoE activity)
VRDRTPDRWWLHVLLFVVTFACVTFSGIVWTARELAYARDAWWTLDWLGLSIGPTALMDGLRFSVPFLTFLTVHEMGHYVAARRAGIDTSPPYFIPLPLVGIGTLGAVIRIREPIPTTHKLFDVGAAGPLAGFVVALATLVYALATLPPPTYLLDMPGHEAVNAAIAQTGTFPDQPPVSDGAAALAIGPTLLVGLLTPLFAHVPPAYELYHYPTLFAAWLGLFFTALNLLPTGQLDGGHVTYSLFGPARHLVLARLTVAALVVLGLLGAAPTLMTELQAWSAGAALLVWPILGGVVYWFARRIFPDAHTLQLVFGGGVLALTAVTLLAVPDAARWGYGFWLFWAFLIVRVIRIEHPPVYVHQRLTPRRRVLAWVCVALFVLCFSPQPFGG